METIIQCLPNLVQQMHVSILTFSVFSINPKLGENARRRSPQATDTPVQATLIDVRSAKKSS